MNCPYKIELFLPFVHTLTNVMRKSLTFTLPYYSIPWSLNMNESACLLSTLETEDEDILCVLFAFLRIVKLCVYVCVSIVKIWCLQNIATAKAAIPSKKKSSQKKMKSLKKEKNGDGFLNTQVFYFLFFSIIFIF